MINNKKVLGIIPARGGSKGVPRKNIRCVAGKPLLVWTIEQAKKSKYLDQVILSSEDKEIIEVAKLWGCDVPFIRPAELARDETPGIEPIFHALKVLPGYDYVVLLQPTSPLRIAADIDGCIEQCVKQGGGACVSVSEADKNPYWMYQLDDNYCMKSVIEAEQKKLRRQDLPKIYNLNGAVYVAKCEWLCHKKDFISSETKAFIMPKERSLDIDSEFDMRVAEVMLNDKKNI